MRSQAFFYTIQSYSSLLRSNLTGKQEKLPRCNLQAILFPFNLEKDKQFVFSSVFGGVDCTPVYIIIYSCFFLI